MNLDLFNNLIKNVKENHFVQNFLNELSDYLKNTDFKNPSNNKIENDLKQEGCLYQVVGINTNTAFLQNVKTNKVYEESDIPKDVLKNIGNDTVLKYKDGQYIVEEEITQKFFDTLVNTNEYNKIQDNFINKSNISQLPSDTIYTILERKSDYSILQYGSQENTIEVPNALIPFFANKRTTLLYENDNFKIV